MNDAICTNCGTARQGWSGRCNECKEWNTIYMSKDLEELQKTSWGRKKLNVGDTVFHDFSLMVGSVEQIRKDENDYNYQVTFGDRQDWFKREVLVKEMRVKNET